MSLSRIESVIDALVTARARHRPALVADVADALVDAEQAYAVQAGVAQALSWFANGSPTFWKSGGQSRNAILTHAALPPDGVWQSPAAAAAWPFNMRCIEAEVALRLGQPVDAKLAATLDRDSARSLIDAMTVSIEVVDSRWDEGMQAPALLRLADLQTHGALVLGSWVPYAARDWARQICRVQIGQRAPVERQGTHPLADPTWLLTDWLRHATRDAQVLAAGTIVTTGTWVGVLEARAGDRVSVEFDGIGSASVQL
ncbi:MAG TPA: fumarylacetoacetate hydrolase family protein [Burkholderiaceae bacterium]|nr:fumarylacetoacetate hydrolase family protein [Burkholderiaceae bacterium]